MSYYAKVNNGIVEQVIVADADFFETFVDSSPGEWIETFHTGERKNFACVGFTYDHVRDAFIPPKPEEDAIFNEETCNWIYPPVAYPSDGKRYRWDKPTKSWIEML
jgi:hypothetical protein